MAVKRPLTAATALCRTLLGWVAVSEGWRRVVGMGGKKAGSQ